MRYVLMCLSICFLANQSHADSDLCADSLSNAEKPKVGEILDCMVKMQSEIVELQNEIVRYALKEEIPDHTDYVKTGDLPNPVDLSGYAKKTDLPKYVLIGQAGDCPAGYAEIGKLQFAIWGADGTAAVRAGWNVHGDVGNGFAATNPRLCSK